jgi:hypothetical protein
MNKVFILIPCICLFFNINSQSKGKSKVAPSAFITTGISTSEYYTAPNFDAGVGVRFPIYKWIYTNFSFIGGSSIPIPSGEIRKIPPFYHIGARYEIELSPRNFKPLLFIEYGYLEGETKGSNIFGVGYKYEERTIYDGKLGISFLGIGTGFYVRGKKNAGFKLTLQYFGTPLKEHQITEYPNDLSKSKLNYYINENIGMFKFGIGINLK